MEYKIDPSVSEIEFSIQHLIISSVKGRFTSFNAGMENAYPLTGFREAHFWCDIEVGSIYTSLTVRDNHLRGPAFFDVASYPQIKFRSTSVEAYYEKYLLKGSLEIKGKQHEVELEGEYSSLGIDLLGKSKFCFELSGAIPKEALDIPFNILGRNMKPLLIGEEVVLSISLRMVQE